MAALQVRYSFDKFRIQESGVAGVQELGIPEASTSARKRLSILQLLNCCNS